MNSVMLDHINLTVANLDRSVEWYRRVFGFELVENGIRAGRPWGIVKNGESMLCLYESAERGEPDAIPETHHRVYHFGLRIADRERWERLLEREPDVKVHHGPIRYPHSVSWYVSDPTGHEIEVALWDEPRARFR